MPLYKPKRTLIADNVPYGVCLWKLPDGRYVQNANQDYLNCAGKVGDKVVEEKMRAAARSLGIEGGIAWWMPGFRQISQMEWDDQMERLQDGKTPDLADVYRELNGGW